MHEYDHRQMRYVSATWNNNLLQSQATLLSYQGWIQEGVSSLGLPPPLPKGVGGYRRELIHWVSPLQKKGQISMLDRTSSLSTLLRPRNLDLTYI